MITSKGSAIIAKYLLGQAPEYAAYLAIGVGSKPLDIDEFDDSEITKKSMDFEAFRVPVTSRGLVNDYVTIDLQSWESDGTTVTITTYTPHGIRAGEDIDIQFSSSSNNAIEGTFIASSTTSNTVSYPDDLETAGSWSSSSGDTGTVSYNRERMIFKAQLPVDQYYKMTEIALYPASVNSLAQQYDSKIIAGFLSNENWSLYENSSGVDIPSVTRTLSDVNGDITETTFAAGIEPYNARFVSSDNETFTFYNRKTRYEGPRVYNTGLMISGSISSFDNDSLDVSSSTSYVQTESIVVDFKKNSKNDYLKFAISVISASEDSSAPHATRVRIEMLDDVSGTSAVAKQTISSGDLYDSRYYVISKKLSEFVVGENFSWGRVSGVRIYVQTVDSGGSSTDDYVVLDGIRLDNENTSNPLYGMVAYSRLKNGYEYGQPIEKIENSQGYIEYRMGVNIV